jgi:hypothetical protein
LCNAGPWPCLNDAKKNYEKRCIKSRACVPLRLYTRQVHVVPWHTMVPVGTRPDHGDEGAAVPGGHGTGGPIPRMVGMSGTISICNNIAKT